MQRSAVTDGSRISLANLRGTGPIEEYNGGMRVKRSGIYAANWNVMLQKADSGMCTNEFVVTLENQRGEVLAVSSADNTGLIGRKANLCGTGILFLDDGDELYLVNRSSQMVSVQCANCSDGRSYYGTINLVRIGE